MQTKEQCSSYHMYRSQTSPQPHPLSVSSSLQTSCDICHSEKQIMFFKYALDENLFILEVGC